MNEFTRREAQCAETIAQQVKQLAASIVKKYAQPQDHDAAAEALLQLVCEKLSTKEKQ